MSGALGALGTLIWDRIRHPSGGAEPVEQWGGAVYSLAALSAACPPGWRVDPLIKVGADLFPEAEELLRSLPHVSPGPGLVRVHEPNNRVELRYHDPAHRCEMLTGGVPPWSWAELCPLVEPLDALYLNFISGFEMDLETARGLRAHFPGPIHADLHSLFLGPPEGGPRPPRRLPDWQAWLACFDVVQMNEEELALLGIDERSIPDLLDLGPSLVVVTLGARGALYAGRGDHLPGRSRPTGSDPLAHGLVAPPAGSLDGDPTGCGDVWGATVFALLLRGARVEDAILQAHRAAARKILQPDTSRLHLALASSTPPGRVLP